MKTRYYLIGLLLPALLAACGPAAESPTPATPTTESEGVLSRPTATPSNALQEAQPEPYPPPFEPSPTPEGYPPPATPLPTIDPYPAGESVWIIRPVGEQCADPEDNEYVDLQEAVADLAAAGVPALSSEMTDLIVCAACGCPTSAHYRVEVDTANLDRAEALGWTREQ